MGIGTFNKSVMIRPLQTDIFQNYSEADFFLKPNSDCDTLHQPVHKGFGSKATHNLTIGYYCLCFLGHFAKGETVHCTCLEFLWLLSNW